MDNTFDGMLHQLQEEAQDHRIRADRLDTLVMELRTLFKPPYEDNVKLNIRPHVSMSSHTVLCGQCHTEMAYEGEDQRGMRHFKCKNCDHEATVMNKQLTANGDSHAQAQG